MSHCDLDIWRTYLKFTGLMHEALPIYKPSFAEIRWKITEKMVHNWLLKLLNRHFIFCVLVTLIFELRTSKCIQLFYLSLSIDRLNLKRVGQKTPEKSCNASRTDFQRLSPRDLDLWPMALQMQMNTTFANVYTPAKFQHDRMKNDREIATSGFSIFVLVTLTFDICTPKCIQLFYQSLSIIWPTLRKIGW